MNRTKLGSTHYRTLARRYAELYARWRAVGLSDADEAELAAVSDEMTTIEALTEDSVQLMAIGDLGGAEI